MPGFLLHFGAQVKCVHMGQATPLMVSPQVSVSGQPIVTKASTYGIVGCTFPAMTLGVQPPCVTAQWVTFSKNVFSNGVPVLLLDSQAMCQPTGTPLLILKTQTQVLGT